MKVTIMYFDLCSQLSIIQADHSFEGVCACPYHRQLVSNWLRNLLIAAGSEHELFANHGNVFGTYSQQVPYQI